MLRRLLLVTALVAALALAACGGGGGGGSAKTPSATKTVTKTPTAQPGATTAASTPTPTAGEATQPAGQPTATLAPTQPPAAQPSNTPPPIASGQAITVGLREYSLALSAGSAHPGTVTFSVSNEGTIPHDLWVIRSDLAVDALPVNPATYLVDESQVNVVARQSPLATEDSAQLPANLGAGRYILICNVATHYATGMRVAFTVQ